MNRYRSVTPVFLVVAVFSLFHANALAQEVYKWTDANGKVHYGDRAAAPESSKKMHIAAEPPRPPPVPATPAAASQPGPPMLPGRDTPRKTVPADPARVGASCKGLIDKIAAVPRGTSWGPLYREFDSACPGIAYECTEYRSSPQKNQCIWIERLGSSVLHKTSYP